MSFRTIALVCAATFGLAAGSAANAQSAVGELTVRSHSSPDSTVQVKSQVVKFADLDLSGTAGAETLVGRIRGAASQVCSPMASDRGNMRDVADYRRCTDMAMAGGVQDTRSDLVQQIYLRTLD